MFENIIFLLCLILMTYVHGVDVDYVNDNSLRTQRIDTCFSGLHRLYCKIKCGTKAGLCIEKHCYCVFAVESMKYEDGPQIIYLAKPGEPVKEINLDANDPLNKEGVRSEHNPDPSVLDQTIIYSLRPTLRHHIAHFCPDLEVARTCIRTCMKMGKPAFCGKDHVCYCGHSYSNPHNDSAANVQETYGQFRDLYEKYFGTGNHGGTMK